MFTVPEQDGVPAGQDPVWWGCYQRYLLSPQWAARRRATLERDGYRCRWCGAQAEHVHHLSYRRMGHELLSDLISLCSSCHDRRHER